MRRNIAKIALCLLAAGMGYLLFWANSRHNKRISAIKRLPLIEAFTIYGEHFDSSKHLDTNKRTALLFFHPECIYCQKELEGIISRHAECRNVQWLFITLAPSEILKDYLSENPLESIPNAFIVREEWPNIYKLFDVKGPPAFFLYDETGNLMKHHMGATSINTIVQDLQ